jgi:hypothetical protein
MPPRRAALPRRGPAPSPAPAPAFDPAALVSIDFSSASSVFSSPARRGGGGGEWEAPEDARARARTAEAEAGRRRRAGGDASIPFCRAIEPGVTPETLAARMRVGEAEARAVEFYEQGTEAWLLSRRGTQTRLPSGKMYGDTLDPAAPHAFRPGRLTASNFGTAVGHNKYAPPETLVEDMLWGTVVSNEAMRYGSMMEPRACEVFEWWGFLLSGGALHVEHRGLMLACPGLWDAGTGTYEGWCGTSPDGIVRPGARGGEARPEAPPSLLEIKCPSVNKRTFYSERAGNERFGIPHYYYDQIMGICGLQHLPDAYFVVHLPDRTQIGWYAFNEPYFRELMRGMRRFWFDLYLPAAAACARGELRVGQVTLPAAPASPCLPASAPAPAAFHLDAAQEERDAEAMLDEDLRAIAALDPSSAAALLLSAPAPASAPRGKRPRGEEADDGEEEEEEEQENGLAAEPSPSPAGGRSDSGGMGEVKAAAAEPEE